MQSPCSFRPILAGQEVHLPLSSHARQLLSHLAGAAAAACGK